MNYMRLLQATAPRHQLNNFISLSLSDLICIKAHTHGLLCITERIKDGIVYWSSKEDACDETEQTRYGSSEFSRLEHGSFNPQILKVINSSIMTDN